MKKRNLGRKNDVVVACLESVPDKTNLHNVLKVLKEEIAKVR